MEKELKNLVKLLRIQAALNAKKMKSDSSHYESMCKGLYLGYEEAASRLNEILKKYEKE